MPWISIEDDGLHHHWNFSKGSPHEWDTTNPDANNYVYSEDALKRAREEFEIVSLDNLEILVFNPPGYDETPALRQACFDNGFLMVLQRRLLAFTKDLKVTDTNSYLFESPDTPVLVKAIRLINVNSLYTSFEEAKRAIDDIVKHRGLLIMIAHRVHGGMDDGNLDYPQLEKIYNYIREKYVNQNEPVYYAFTSEIVKYFINRKNTEIRYKLDKENKILKAKLNPKRGIGNVIRFFSDVGISIYFEKPKEFSNIVFARVSYDERKWYNVTNKVIERNDRLIVTSLSNDAVVEIYYK